MVYDKSGNATFEAYNENGERLVQAYDISGQPLFAYDIVAMTYNVEWFSGINANKTMQDGIISDYDPDVIGIEEFQNKGSNSIPPVGQQVLSGFADVKMGDYGNKNGFASKTTLSDFNTVPCTVQTMEDTYGGQSYSTAKTTIDGKEIFLLVGHTTTHKFGIDKMEDQTEEIFDALQNHEYFIMFADLNTTCRSTSDQDYTAIMKRFVDAGYNCSNCYPKNGSFIALDTWNGGTGTGTWYPTDHVITSSNIEILHVVVDKRKIQVAQQTGQTIDHLPLIAYLRFKEQREV